MRFTDEQRAGIAPLLPPLPRRPDRRGRPGHPDRPVLEAEHWRIQTGSWWSDLPAHYPPPTPVSAATTSGSALASFRAWPRISVRSAGVEVAAALQGCGDRP